MFAGCLHRLEVSEILQSVLHVALDVPLQILRFDIEFVQPRKNCIPDDGGLGTVPFDALEPVAEVEKPVFAVDPVALVEPLIRPRTDDNVSFDLVFKTEQVRNNETPFMNDVDVNTTSQ